MSPNHGAKVRVQETAGQSAENLERLNEAEREVLILLAHGHTAKSIAVLTGRSAGAVNERLREARRKTGVGSSRELARLLLSRKNGSEQIGMAAQPSPDAPLGEGDPPPAARLRTRGGLIMAALLIAVAGAGALALSAPGEPARAPDGPVPGAAAGKDEFARKFVPNHGPMDPQQLHAALLAETRDPKWAPRMEAVIRDAYDRIAFVGTAAEPIEVRCAATLCEVAGRFDIPPEPRLKVGPNGEVPPSKIGKAMSEMQDGRLNKALEPHGLEVGLMSFGQSPDDKERSTFLGFWRRKKV
jgi:DNA-binding CsgD family transcriptional regulator